MDGDEPGVVLGTDGLDELIRRVRELGYDTVGPVVRDGAVVPGPVGGLSDLPVGWHDDQEPGRYRLHHGDDPEVFGWAVGPGSAKARFFPPSEVVWRTTAPATGPPDAAGVAPAGPPDAGEGHDRPAPAPVALIGARPCELAATAVLDRVLLGGAVPDPAYGDRRAGTLVVAAECGAPASTCFCTSMGTGPSTGDGYDIALTELGGPGGHRFLARPGTSRGAELLAGLRTRPATPADRADRQAVLARAGSAVARRLDTDDLPGLLARNVDHPRWEEVAERCVACGNCTLVCPTCFCSDVRDTTDLAGNLTRQRSWASCFDLDHSYLHGGPVRRSVSSRYRQWMTHKLSTWWEQFGTSGCVGCGRCLTWCPVGIDLTEEAAAIRASDGAGRAGRGPA